MVGSTNSQKLVKICSTGFSIMQGLILEFWRMATGLEKQNSGCRTWWMCSWDLHIL